MKRGTHYGRTLFSYEGRGTLETAQGDFNCRFELFQLHDGVIYGICRRVRHDRPRMGLPVDAVRLSGATSDGWSIEATGRPTPTNILGEEEASDVLELAFRFNRAVAEQVALGPSDITLEVFGLTNFLLRGTDAVYVGPDDIRERVSVNTPHGEIILQTGPDYRARALALRTHRETAVTFEALLQPEADSVADVETLSYLLTIARGSKVQWLYREHLDEQDVVVRREHEGRHTQAYTPVAPFQESRPDHVARFVEQAWTPFLEKEARLSLKIVADILAGAARQSQFIEARGLQLAIALEALKNAFAEDVGWDVSYLVEPASYEAIWDEVSASLRRAFVDAGVGRTQAENLTGKGKGIGLNRKSFRSLLKALARESDFALDADELNAFVASRNKLVHTGRFLTSAGDSHPLFASPAEEYFFDAYFVQKFLLGILGYDGPFHDVRTMLRTRQGTAGD